VFYLSLINRCFFCYNEEDFTYRKERYDSKKQTAFFAFNCTFCGTLAFFNHKLPLLFAYFNSHDYAALFATAMAVLRVPFLLWIALWGYSALKEHPPSSWLYLALFFLNLIVPYFFR